MTEPIQTEPIQTEPIQTEPIQQTSAFDELMSKKGFKSNDDVAKSYFEAESTLGRTQSAFNTTKQQLEAAGYTIDEKGNVKPINQQTQDVYGNQSTQQGYTLPYGQYQQPYGQQQADPVYDPYTGHVLTNPIDIQLAHLPPSQRISVVTTAIIENREKQQREAFQVEQEVLNDPSAKGFENDVRNIMAQIPLSKRVNKDTWKDALLKAKGMRYDDSIKNAGAQGVEDFINKQNAQPLNANQGGSGGGSVRLTAEQEQTYKYYKERHPGMFKDRASFARRLKNTNV